MKYTNDALNNMRQPASASEEQKISNAISMVKDAINNNDDLKDLNIEIFVKGSYANDTNIKIDSDIDVSVMWKDTFYTRYRDGATGKDYGMTSGGGSLEDFRSLVISALKSKFGKDNVDPGNKSIQINSNSYRVQADVIPSLQYRNYYFDKNNDPDNFIEGTKYFAQDGTEIINYPKQQVENNKVKNANTAKRYKRTVRLFKRIKNNMVSDNIQVPDGISSFLLECLVYQVPNKSFNSDPLDWNTILRESIIYLYNQIIENKVDKWVESSGRLYLFHSGRKWTKEEVKTFLVQMWNYLEYNKG